MAFKINSKPADFLRSIAMLWSIAVLWSSKLFAALLACCIAPLAVAGSSFFPAAVSQQVQPFQQWNDAQASAINVPGYANFVIDPDTDRKVWRLGGSGAEMGQTLGYPGGNGAIGILHGQHFYSKTSPTNAAESHVLSSGGQNQRYAALWDLSTRRLVAWVPGPEQQAHIQQRHLLWDKQQANAYWYTEGNRLIKAEVDFQTYQVQTRVWDVFENYQYITFGFGEGNFSDDGTKLVLAGKGRDSYIYFTPYEAKARRKHARRQVTSATQTEFDWAGVDPTGEYILFDRHQPYKQTVAVTFARAANAEPHELYPHTKHSDFVIDQSGVPWIVYGNWRGVFASRLSDGADKKIWPEDNPSLGLTDDVPQKVVTASGHVARVATIPGLVLVSRHYDGGLYYMNIDLPGHSVYLGNSRHGRLPIDVSKKQKHSWGVDHNGEVTFYKREPRGAVSASGRYIFFVSDYQAYLNAGGYDPEPEWAKAYLNIIDLGQ